MKASILIAGLGLILASGGYRAALAQATLPADFSVAKPVIPDHMFNIKDYGAVGDGRTLTDAIAKAIAAASDAGGGMVEVPAGKFLTAPFHLASNLNLHLDDGATILFSDRRSDFKLTDGGYEICMTAMDCHDLEITGSGTIDGNGRSWWSEFLDYKNGQTTKEPPHRPYMIMLTSCTRVMLQGVSLVNSPMFHLVPRVCRDVTIDSIRIKSPADSPNTDGIDPSGWNYHITGCTIDTGDDNIALKPRPVPDKDHLSCEDILIEHCAFLHGHGMSIGGGSNGGVRNMLVRDCTFDGTDAGVRLKSGRDRGGLVENLTYENLKMTGVKIAVSISSYYPQAPKELEMDPAQPITAKTPIWRHIRITNVVSRGFKGSVSIVGLAESPVEDVVFTNVQISAREPVQIIRARGIRFVNSKVVATSGRPNEIVDSDVQGLE